MKHAWLIVVCLGGVLVAGGAESVRVWHSVTGKALKASLVADKGAIVLLKNESGRTIEIKRSYLSKADLDFLEQLKKGAEEEVKPLEFKGLRTGMAKADVNKLARETPWEYEEGGAASPKGTRIFLVPGISSEAGFYVVGTYGGKTASWSRVCILYKHDRIYNISVMAPPHLLDAVDPGITDWLAAGLATLQAKYGKPEFVHRDAGRPHNAATIKSSLQRLASYEHAKWQVGKSRQVKLRVSGCKLDGEYYGEIVLTDLALKNQKRKIRRSRPPTEAWRR